MPLSQLSDVQLLGSLVSTIRLKLAEEGTLRLCTVLGIPAKNPLSIDESNGVLFEFPGLPPRQRYRLLLVLSLFKSQFTESILSPLDRVIQMTNADRVLLWTIHEPDNRTIGFLKKINADFLHVPLPTSADITQRVIRNFIHLQHLSYDQIYALNVLANRIIKRLRKKFHLVLSEVAAPVFDATYGKDNFATQKVMEFEERLLSSFLKSLAPCLPSDSMAVDVGCGTGRHSLMLAKFFKEIIAFDFSQEMINVCIEKRKERDLSNLIFYVNDFEYEEFPQERDFFGRVDFICASFGMGSYIEDTQTMLRRFSNWLKPSGKLFLSFYNRQSLTVRVIPNWRDSSLATRIDIEKQSLEVNLGNDVRFEIFCKPFDGKLKDTIEKVFKIDQILTYPTTMAILPNSLFSNPLAREVFAKADESLADYTHCQNGHYVMLLATKRPPGKGGYENVLRLLEFYGCSFEILDHDPVISLADVRRQLEMDPASMVKTVVFRSRKTGQFIAAIIPFDKRADREAIANLLGEQLRNIQLAGESEIAEKLGFPIGGVAPFGFVSQTEVYIDEYFFQVDSDFLYMGVGDNRKTLKLTRGDFLRIVSNYRRAKISQNPRA